MWSTVILALIFLYYFIKENSKMRGSFPPGPTPLPFVGNLLTVCLNLKQVKKKFKLWQLWSKQYGNILGLKLGVVDLVIVSGKDYIKEVSSREVFQGRPNGFLFTMRSFGMKLGLVFADGPSWSKARRFVLKYIKTVGYNTRLIDSYIEEECKYLVEMRMADAGRPVLVNTMFNVTNINILWRLVAGKRYDLNDARLNHLCDVITELFKAVDMSGGLLNFLPFLRHIIPDVIGYTKIKDIHNELHQFIEMTIKEHRDTIDVNNPRDLIDALIIEADLAKDCTFTQEEVQVICLDLLEAGMETVSNTAAFMLLHIVRNDAVQSKLQREIDDTIGHTRTPVTDDRMRMVYTEAVILETLRISTVAAVGIPHMALEDAQLGGYAIPKGTVILLAMYDLHNGTHWKSPETFCPERFLTKDENLLQDEWLMPFGAGKRRCIGESLARSQLFMILTHILQKFTLKVPEGDPLPSTELVEGMSLSPIPFKISFEPRMYNKSV